MTACRNRVTRSLNSGNNHDTAYMINSCWCVFYLLFSGSSSFSFFFKILLWVICLMCAVEALREIAAQLGKKDWNRSVNPCNAASWRTPNSVGAPYNNTVNCNCSYPNGVCHVVKMYAPLARIMQTYPSWTFLWCLMQFKRNKFMNMMCNLV